jgi:NADPH-dependent 2,4-dienoyl-CoA reductase/sulfur reductase-like enzyme
MSDRGGSSGYPSREDTLVHDVIIAGAGPVGLFLACELRLAKVSVLVLEQQEDPRGRRMGERYHCPSRGSHPGRGEVVLDRRSCGDGRLTRG